jgi:hypothetical protein
MIQDSINQMLATAAIGTKLASGSIAESKNLKMEKLSQQQQKNLDTAHTWEDGNTPPDPQEKLKQINETQRQIEKLGNSKVFPNTNLLQRSREMSNAVSSYTDDLEKQVADRAMRRAESRAILKQTQAKEFFGNRFKVDQPSEELIKAIQGGRD